MEMEQKLLIVDDRPENIFSLKQVLADINADIISASTGNEALIACLNHEFALAILDVQMPEMDGYELAELIRSEKKTHQIPIIFVSAVYSNEYHVFKGYDSGAVDFLVKPFNDKILLSKVTVFLELDRHKKRLRESKAHIANQLSQLKASERRFESLVLTIPDIIYRIDPEGNFTFVNDAIEKLGYLPQELMGVHFSTIIWPFDVDNISRVKFLEKYNDASIPHEKPIKLFDERRTGKRKTTGLEIRLIPKKGTQLVSGILERIDDGDDAVVVEVNSAGLYSDRMEKKNKIFIGSVGVIRDITDRKKLEDSLRRANEELEIRVQERTSELIEKNQTLISEMEKRKTAENDTLKAKKEWKEIIEAIGHMTMILTKNYTIVSVNRSTIEQTGMSKEVLIGKRCYEIFHNSSTPHKDCPMKYFLDSGDVKTSEIEIENLGKTYIISCTPVFNDKGEIQKIIHIATDVTQRKQLEKELIQAHKMEAIGILAGGIAHDFNNILSILLGFAELSMQYAEKGSMLEGDLKEIYKAGIRAKDLVRQILTFARKTDQEFSPFRVDLIIKEVVKFIRSAIPSTIEIRHDLQTTSKIFADVGQIHQVLMNLCTNASYAMRDKGGGVLNISLKNIQIDQEQSQLMEDIGPGACMELKVSDTGTGIPPKVMDHIFEPYYTTKGVGEGTGMGLAVVQSIIKNTGGSITVKSEVGRGTVFTILLPITTENIIAYQEKPDTTMLTGNEHILLVDDEPAIAEIGKRILEKSGYTVTIKNNPVDAIKLFAEDPDKINLIITDMTMPKMTGDMFIAEIWKMKPGMPAILCTGYTDKLLKGGANKTKIGMIIYKPFNKGELLKAVRNVLDN